MNARGLAKMHPARRQALLETAAREFATAGYEGASLNRIIKSCRMSKSSFYHFIGSKENLFDLVVRESVAALQRELAIPAPEEAADPGFWERIAELGYQLLALAERNAWYVDIGKLFYLSDTPEAAGHELRQATERIGAWLDAALAAGRAAGNIRSDLPPSLQAELTFAVVRALDRWSVRHMAELAAGAGPDLIHIQVDAIRRLLAP